MDNDNPPKVVGIRGGQIIPEGEPVPQVVEALEQLLHEAKEGKIISICAVGVLRKGDITFAHSVAQHLVAPIFMGLDLAKNMLVSSLSSQR